MLPVLALAGCAGGAISCHDGAVSCGHQAPAHETFNTPLNRQPYPYASIPSVVYVGPGGDIANPGSPEAPVDTVANALARVRAIRDKDPAAAIKIELLPGTHYLPQPVLIGPEDSGSKQAPLIISGANYGGGSTLSGGRRLDTRWQEGSNGLWWTQVDGADFDQLFINGEKQIRARYPNFDPAVAIFNGYASESEIRTRAKGWTNPKGGFLHALHSARWGGFHYEIAGKDRNGELLLSGGWQNNRPSAGKNKQYQFVDNIREELDHAGEWFYDRDISRLFFMPPPEMDMAATIVEVSGLEELLIVRGSSDKPVKNIRIENLSFKHAAETLMHTSEPLLRSDWTIYRGGALFIEGAENIQVAASRFLDLGGNGVFVSGYARDVTIVGNHFSNLGATAIAFVGRPSSVRSPSYQYHDAIALESMDMQPGPKGPDYPARSLADNNLIHHTGRLEKQSAGIQLSMASKITLRHNSIYSVPRSGINISEGTWGGHIVEYNDVFDTVLETEDHGAFNSWGRDRFWHPNRSKMDKIASEKPGLPLLDAIDTTIIRNNRFQTSHGWDIDLDDGSSNYHIYNNLCLEGGLKLREGFARTVENNILVNNGFHPHAWFDNSGDVFRHNIVMRKHADVYMQSWGREVDFNIFPSIEALQAEQDKGIEKNGIAAQLAFFDPSAGDFRIKNNPAVFASGFKNFPMDLFGVTRPELKAIAQQPSFPIVSSSQTVSSHSSDPITWRGLQVKNIETLGERSAAGLNETSGVLILQVPEDSPGAGVIAGDVIVAARIGSVKREIKTVSELQTLHQSASITLTVVRNQRPTDITLEN